MPKQSSSVYLIAVAICAAALVILSLLITRGIGSESTAELITAQKQTTTEPLSAALSAPLSGTSGEEATPDQSIPGLLTDGQAKLTLSQDIQFLGTDPFQDLDDLDTITPPPVVIELQ
jgi:hypothetical protein